MPPPLLQAELDTPFLSMRWSRVAAPEHETVAANRYILNVWQVSGGATGTMMAEMSAVLPEAKRARPEGQNSRLWPMAGRE